MSFEEIRLPKAVALGLGDVAISITGVQLADFCRHAAGRRFSWGEWDCGMLCADWVRRKTGLDPAEAWRGHYSTAVGLARLVKQRGGMVSHFDACLSPLGFLRTPCPEKGDVAIVETPEGETGAVVLGTTVLMAAECGILIRSRAVAPVVAAWRL